MKKLQVLTISELTNVINRIHEKMDKKLIKPLKCSKAQAIERAKQLILSVRKKRNKRQFKKLSRQLMCYV